MNSAIPSPLEELGRVAHRSLAITFGSTASRHFDAIRLERIGFVGEIMDDWFTFDAARRHAGLGGLRLPG